MVPRNSYIVVCAPVVSEKSALKSIPAGSASSIAWVLHCEFSNSHCATMSGPPFALAEAVFLLGVERDVCHDRRNLAKKSNTDHFLGTFHGRTHVDDTHKYPACPSS